MSTQKPHAEKHAPKEITTHNSKEIPEITTYSASKKLPETTTHTGKEITFDSFNFEPQIKANLRTLNYKTPTPIQQKAIPVLMNDQDVMGLAQTGTGKTAAFVLPMLQRLMTGPRGRVRALIIAPTRELAQQIHEAIYNFGKGTGLRCTAIYGGTNMGHQIRDLRRGVEIVVACPGRLLDHVDRRNIDLRDLEVLVLDEADQMFDMGFLPNIRKILQQLPKERQSMLFSATMPSAIRQLANEVLHKPVVIQIGHEAPASSVKQAMFPVAPHLKTDLLVKILQTTDTGSVLVFTRTKDRAHNVALQLEELGYKSASMHGNLTQKQRQRALSAFSNGQLQILVATDVAARGIDVAGISHVINYDMPNTVEAYIHRIGRTGRASKTGDAFTLLTREDIRIVRGIERMLGVKLEMRTIPGFSHGNSGMPVIREAPRKRFQHQQQRPFQQNRRRSEAGAGDARSFAGDRDRRPQSSSRPYAGGDRRQDSSSRPYAGVRSERPAHGARSESSSRPYAGRRTEFSAKRSHADGSARPSNNRPAAGGRDGAAKPVIHMRHKQRSTGNGAGNRPYARLPQGE